MKTISESGLSMYMKERQLLNLAQKLAKTAAQHTELTRLHDQLLSEMGYMIEYDAGMEFHQSQELPDWYVNKIDYYGGAVTIEDIQRLLSQLHKKKL